MNENVVNRLMDYFIMEDFMMCNKWLPIDPRRQAMTDYQTDPTIQNRVNNVVENILKIMEDDNGSLHSEKD